MSANSDILVRHVRLFNDGVRTGDFSQMLNYFSEDAEMYFEGIPVGPFKGRMAIQRAYSAMPPDDEIIVLRIREGSGKDSLFADYAWSKEPAVKAGELRIVTKEDQITRLTILYER